MQFARMRTLGSSEEIARLPSPPVRSTNLVWAHATGRAEADLTDNQVFTERTERKALRDLLDFAGPDARCAHSEPPAGAFHQSANRLQIDVPAALRHVVRMTDPIAELRASSANLTNLRHKTKISRFRILKYINPGRAPATG